MNRCADGCRFLLNNYCRLRKIPVTNKGHFCKWFKADTFWSKLLRRFMA